MAEKKVDSIVWTIVFLSVITYFAILFGFEIGRQLYNIFN